jgi:cell division protein FtsB
MKLHWDRLKRGAVCWAGRAKRAALVAALVLLGGALAVQAYRSRTGHGDLERRAAALDGEIARLESENRAMRAELKALETDPWYVESLLRRWKMARPGERVVE